MAKNHDAPIIIVKKKKKGQHDEHSSAWKIALADFMTALMCFFLVMWLTSILKTDTQKDISRFFSASGIDENDVGIGGILGGTTITADGPLTQMSAAFSLTPPMGAEEETESEVLGRYAPPGEEDRHTLTFSQEPPLSAEELKALAKEVEQTIESVTGKGKSSDMAHIVAVPEGIRIDFLDSYQKPMFQLGSSQLMPQAKKMMEKVAKKLEKLPGGISIIGHTDSLPYANKDYTNWELSADRANATRRFMQKKSPHITVNSVVGKASSEPYRPSRPLAPSNRRISVIAHRAKPKDFLGFQKTSPYMAQKESSLNDSSRAEDRDLDDRRDTQNHLKSAIDDQPYPKKKRKNLEKYII